MRKALLLLMCLMLTCTSVSAGAVTLAELRTEVPDRLVLEVDGPNGTVSIDAPIVLPDGETLPILQAKRLTFHAANLLEQFPLGRGATQSEKDAASPWNYDGTPILAFTCAPQDGRASLLLASGLGECARFPLPVGEQPPGNDMPASRPMEIVREIVGRFGTDAEVDIRERQLIGQSGLFRYSQNIIDPNKPVKGYEKGSWALYVAQYMRGVEIFGGRYNPFEGFEKQTQEIWPELVLYTYMHIMDEDDFSVNISLLREDAVLMEDVSLAPFSEIQSAITKRIAEGQLQSVYRVSLGYSISMNKGDSLRSGGLANTDMPFILTPVWQVKGYDLKDKESREWAGYTEPTVDEVLNDGRNTFELRLDARTGKPLEGFHFEMSP